MKTLTSITLALTVTACGTQDLQKLPGATQGTTTATTTGSVTETAPAPSESLPGAVAAPVVEDGNTVAGNPNVVQDTNAPAKTLGLCTQVDPNGVYNLRCGLFQGGSVTSPGNFDGCYVLAGTDPNDPNNAGYLHPSFSFAFDPNRMAYSAQDDSVTYQSATVGNNGEKIAATWSFYSDGTGQVEWHGAGSPQSAGCSSYVRVAIESTTTGQINGFIP